MRTPAGAGGKSLRKRSWGGDVAAGETNKENLSVGETVEEVDENEPPALIGNDDESEAAPGDESDSGTLRRSSWVTGSELYTESEQGYSEMDETASEWTESVVSSALTASEVSSVEGSSNDMVLYGQ